MGQVLGSQLLANYGPRIPISISAPWVVLAPNISNRFENAGMKRTRLGLLLDIETQVQVVVPIVTSEVTVQTEVTITDTVIVGRVSNFYGNFFTGGSQ